MEHSSVQVVSSNTEARTVPTTQDSTAIPALNARVVDEEALGPIVEAKPMEEDSVPTETDHLKALFKSRKCRIISLLAIMFIPSSLTTWDERVSA